MGQCMMQWTIYVHGKFQIEQDFVHGGKKRQTSILIDKWLRVLMNSASNPITWWFCLSISLCINLKLCIYKHESLYRSSNHVFIVFFMRSFCGLLVREAWEYERGWEQDTFLTSFRLLLSLTYELCFVLWKQHHSYSIKYPNRAPMHQLKFETLT
jgi:hypothetical protein